MTRSHSVRIAGESQFAEIAGNQPEILACPCTEAGHTEKAARLWGKAGQRSLARSALVEAVKQLKRALERMAMLPATPVASRRDQASSRPHNAAHACQRGMRHQKPRQLWSGHVC
jgi:predicted ATPase